MKNTLFSLPGLLWEWYLDGFSTKSKKAMILATQVTYKNGRFHDRLFVAKTREKCLEHYSTNLNHELPYYTYKWGDETHRNLDDLDHVWMQEVKEKSEIEEKLKYFFEHFDCKNKDQIQAIEDIKTFYDKTNGK